MKYKKCIILNLFLFSIFSLGFSQETNNKESEEFKPSGKIIARGFLDYSIGLNENNKGSGFDVTRAFLGYNYKFTKSLQAQVVIDGASGNTKGNLDTYIRNAFVKWENRGFSLSAGLVGLIQFSEQEKYWEHRYVLKSFQDLNKMGSSVDAGVIAEYKISPFFSADITLINGSGAKKIEKTESKKYGLGLSVKPIKNVIFRAYGDVFTDSEKLRDALPNGVTETKYKNQYALSLFTGYKNDIISAGVEYNKTFNKGFINKKDCEGYSIYSTVKIAPKWGLYGRYDLMTSTAPSSYKNSWNNLDGQMMIIGAEYKPVKQLKLSPNFRNISLDGVSSKQYIYLNAEFNL